MGHNGAGALHQQFARLLTEASYAVAGSVFLETQQSARSGRKIAQSAASRLLKLGGPVCSEYHMLVVDCQNTAKGALACHVVHVHSNHRVVVQRRLRSIAQGQSRVRELSTGSQEEVDELCALIEKLSLDDDDSTGLSSSCGGAAGFGSTSRSGRHRCRTRTDSFCRHESCADHAESFFTTHDHDHGHDHDHDGDEEQWRHCWWRQPQTSFEILGEPAVIQLGKGKPNFMTQVMATLEAHGLRFDDVRIIILAGVDLNGTVGDWALLRSVSRTGRTFRTGCPMLENSSETALNTKKSGLGLTDSMLYISSELLRTLEQGFDAKVFAQVLGVQPCAMWFFDAGEEHLNSMRARLPRKVPLLQLTNGDPDDESDADEGDTDAEDLFTDGVLGRKLKFSTATKYGLANSSSSDDSDEDLSRFRKRCRKFESGSADESKSGNFVSDPTLPSVGELVDELETKKRDPVDEIEEGRSTRRLRSTPPSIRRGKRVRSRTAEPDTDGDDDSDSSLAKRTREILADEATQRTLYRMLGADFADAPPAADAVADRSASSNTTADQHAQEVPQEQQREEQQQAQQQDGAQGSNLARVGSTAPHVPSMTVAF